MNTNAFRSIISSSNGSGRFFLKLLNNQNQAKFASPCCNFALTTKNQHEFNRSSSSTSFGENRASRRTYLASLCAAGLLGLTWLGYQNFDVAHCDTHHKVSAGKFRPELPTYTEEELSKHNKDAETIWIAYKEGVYDITDFVQSHPGGNKILIGAGLTIEPFWQMYPVHYKSETFALLEKYRIGNLKISESKPTANSKSSDPFGSDPKRHPLLKVLSDKPFNAECPKEISVDNLITPTELHFVRNHLPVPKVDIENYRLKIVNDSTGEKFEFELDDLKKKFKVYTFPVTLQCSGNKRKYMNDVEPVQGLMWDANGISTANWTGVLLKDVLDACHIDLDDSNIRHVQFDGLDKDPTGSCYGASVPKEKVTSSNGDVLLAFQMNGKDIPLDHGYPLRAVVPGVTGARSVKWVERIVLSKEESTSHWQRNDYKLLPATIKNIRDADFNQYKAIQESSVQSAICEPSEGQIIEREDGSFTAKGYAFSGGGNSIEKVIVSIDNGKTWHNADIRRIERPLYRCWSWVIWECDVEIPKELENQNQLQLVCTAVDSEQNSQPESPKSIWNIRGLMNNSWHRVNIQLK